jgi:AraC-like DNA-binding protein
MKKGKRSLSTIVRSYKRGHFVAAHSHKWPQLLYASSGVMAVETSSGSWIVPASRAVWLPAGCMHETRMLTDVRFNSLYMRSSKLWRHVDCKVIEIAPLLRELILVGRTINLDAELSRHSELVLELILEELQTAKSVASPIPMPREGRLLRLCRMVIEDPSLHKTFDRLAVEAGGSTKTFARLFDRELGVTFREWRELVQLGHAVALLAQGDSVKAAASVLGYTPSAFSVMMRRLTGSTPQALQRHLVTVSPPTPETSIVVARRARPR